MKTSLKQHKRGVDKRSVSAPQELFSAADKRSSKLRITNFSEYVRHLMRRDLDGEMNVARKEAA